VRIQRPDHRLTYAVWRDGERYRVPEGWELHAVETGVCGHVELRRSPAWGVGYEQRRDRGRVELVGPGGEVIT
jgi:hypothetical protein